MSDNSDTWKWVDEDPIEKMLRPSAANFKPDTTPHFGAAAHIADGRAHFERQRFEEAARAYSAATEAEPDHPTAHFDLGVCLDRLGHSKAAANAFRKALEIDAARWEALIGLGACLLQLDAVERALNCFEQCLRSAAAREAALFGKAVALQKLERYDEAERCYGELLDIDPDAVEPLANLIALNAAREDFPALGAWSRRLLSVNPQSKAALQGMATLAIRSGDRAAAIEFCTRLVEVDPDSFEGWFNLRFAQQRMTPPEQAARSIA